MGDVNRKDLQYLARTRLLEAKALLAAGSRTGAYYLAGYAVECALKACIAKGIQRHDFPGKEMRRLLILSWRVWKRLRAAKPSEAYGLVHDALAASGVSLERTPPLLILKMSDPFVRSLRRIFRKGKRVEGMRLGGQRIGDQFVPDALVYRIR